ncbi:MAG TPA: SMC-Scp complex subunit ScpB [Terracidiphilus sp.]|nr:SMC-Scp complex subunit ScpB [Terracidiphilus sp.]
MSLKSKLEAVIYAADEPVTLAQLAALFAAEALEWKAEREAKQAAKAAADAAAADSTHEPAEPPALPLEGADAPESEAAATTASEEPDAEPAPGKPPDPEAEARRAARQREREVKAVLHALLDELIAGYAGDDRGVEMREIAGGYRMATKPECHDAVRLFIKSLKPPMKLSLPALETLAVIAYKQPVTAPEVNEIRGVESAGVLGSLLSRKLIATAGRKQVIGRPILYKTTREFLLRFGLKDLSEMPSMEEFEKIAALELNEPEPESEAEPENAEDVGPATGPDFDEDAYEEPETESESSPS